MTTLVIHGDKYLDIETGVYRKLDELPSTLLGGSQGFICGSNLFEPLASLNTIMGNVPRWRMSVTVAQRRSYTRDGRIAISGIFQVSYISFRLHASRLGGGRRTAQNGVRWDVLNLETFMDPTGFTLQETVEASKAILTLCESRGVTIGKSRGSLARKLLRASPQWNATNEEQGQRRPAPKWINDEARKHSPGNHYSISNKIRKAVSIPHCYYIDQTSAHHSIASQISLPHPNHIRGRGFTKEALQQGHYPKWSEQVPVGHTGLFCCHVEIYQIPLSLKHLYPKWVTQRKPGHHVVWLYTPEIRLIENDHLVNLQYVTCGFSTMDSDPALTEYAEWSLEYLKRPDKKYTKATLLAAYGMLQFNPIGWKSYRYWGGTAQSKGTPIEIPVAGPMKEVCVSFPEWVQLDTTNVCARGMIESETRTRSLEYARELHHSGYHVVQVYADALVVETDHLPFVRQGWRIDKSLTNVLIPAVNSIVSDQMVKRPGLNREDSERVRQAHMPNRPDIPPTVVKTVFGRRRLEHKDLIRTA